jgi:hypothetical protein
MANTKTPHKHAEVIRASADGATVEDFDDADEVWYVIDNPSFHTSMKYRVQPEPKKHKYRVALMSDGKDAWTTTEDYGDDNPVEGFGYFVRYLTDWIEVEV